MSNPDLLALREEIAQLRTKADANIHQLRLAERDEEYRHRLLELDLACSGIEPVGTDPRAPSHGNKAFVKDMQGIDFDNIAPVLKQIHEQGYVVVRDFLNADEIAQTTASMQPLFEATARLFLSEDTFQPLNEGSQTIHVQNVLAKSDAADDIASKPHLRAILAGILGQDFIFNAGAVAMSPDPGCSPQGLHRDDGFYTLIPRPHIPLVVTVAVALDDFFPDNGSTQLISGSHLWSAARMPEPSEVIQAEMPAGSLLIWDGALFHGGGGNRTNESRRTLTLNYTRGWLRTQFNQYLSVPRNRVLNMRSELQADLGYHRSALGLGGADLQDPLKYLERLQAEGEDGHQPFLGREQSNQS